MSHYKMRSKDSFRSHLSCTRYHHSRKCYFNHGDMADLEQTILRALRKALREDDAGKDPGEAEASGPSPAVLASAIETAADTGLPVAERRAALRGVLREVRFSKKRGCLELVLNHGDLAGVTTSVDLSG